MQSEELFKNDVNLTGLVCTTIKLKEIKICVKIITAVFTISGLDRLIPPGANPLDPHWLDIQRRFGPHMLPGGSGSSHLPGIYPPTSIASDLVARERERLERLG